MYKYWNEKYLNQINEHNDVHGAAKPLCLLLFSFI